MRETLKAQSNNWMMRRRLIRKRRRTPDVLKRWFPWRKCSVEQVEWRRWRCGRWVSQWQQSRTSRVICISTVSGMLSLFFGPHCGLKSNLMCGLLKFYKKPVEREKFEWDWEKFIYCAMVSENSENDREGTMQKSLKSHARLPTTFAAFWWFASFEKRGLIRCELHHSRNSRLKLEVENYSVETRGTELIDSAMVLKRNGK